MKSKIVSIDLLEQNTAGPILGMVFITCLQCFMIVLLTFQISF